MPMQKEETLWKGSPKFLAYEGLGVIICAIITIIYIAFIVGLTEISISMTLLLALPLLIPAGYILCQYLVCKSKVYYFSEKEIAVKKGILNRTTCSFDCAKVQRTTLKRSVLQKLLRVGTIEFELIGENRNFYDIENCEEVFRLIRQLTLVSK